jgi:hypothetical protein
LESQYCIFTIALAVVVTIVVLSVLILVRDVVRFFYRKTRIERAARNDPSSPARREERIG